MWVKSRSLPWSVPERPWNAASRFFSSVSERRWSVASRPQLLAVDVELERRHGLVEQPVPGLRAGHRLFVEQFLDAILELVGLCLPQLVEPRPEAGELLVGGKRLLQHGVVDPVELELEEDEAGGKIGELLAHVAEEFGAVLVGRVLRVVEIGEGADPARDVAKFLGPADRFDQLAVAGQLRRACPCSRPRTPWPRVSRPVEVALELRRNRPPDRGR